MALKKATHCEERCEIQGGGQEMAVNGNNFNIDNSGEFGAKIFITTIQLNLVPNPSETGETNTN